MDANIVLRMPPRCFLGCSSDLAVHLHVFPNPERFPEQFKKWVEIVGGQLNTPNDYAFFRKKRLCDRHFTEKDQIRNNRLNALAVPSLFLRDGHVKCLPTASEIQTDTSIDVPLLQKTSLTDSARAEPGDQLSELDMDIPLLQTSLKEFLRDDLVGHSTIAIKVPEKQTADVIIPPLQPRSLSEKPADHLVPAVQVPNSQPEIEVTNDVSSVQTTCLIESPRGSNRSIFLEHNYSIDQHSKKYNVASVDVFRKKPFLSLNKYKTEQRQIRNLKRQINALRKRSTSFKNRLASALKMSVDSALQRVTKNMTSAAKLFTYMQFSQTQKKPPGRRFSLEEKIMSLSILKQSPKCYSFLSHCFTLPSKKTLKGLLSQIKLEPGVNEKFFDKLKNTVKELNIEDRLCSIIFDEMSLTPQINYDIGNDKLKGFASPGTTDHKNQFADHALVFMVKGIKANFKQPVAYYFTNSLKRSKLKNIIREVIQKVQATGLIILCSVCDQSSVNVGAISDLVQETKNKILRQGNEWRHDFFEINEQKIIPLFDVPHLLKGLRNNLLNKDLVYLDADDGNKEKIVKWQHFQDIYEADKTFGELRLLNKVTEEHINPQKIKKMRVKTAAQIFSHSVAVVAEHLTARGVVNEECRHLIPLVLLIDKLFDSLNNNTFHIPNGKIYKGCVRKSSPHHRLWTKAKILLKSMKFILKKKTGNKIRLVASSVPTTNNFVKTIEGFEVLWTILSKKYHFDCMMTRHFNQDPVENFFGNIRSYGARNNSPNVVSFEGAFKALLLNNYNSPHSLSANCEKDENNCLQTLDFFISEKQQMNTEVIPEDKIEINEDLLLDREKEIDMGQRNYVCGWVVRKCLKYIVKGCGTCKAKLICKKDNEDNQFIKLREYNKNKKWQTYPSDEAVNLFYEIQSNTVSFLKRNVPHKGIKIKIMFITKTLYNTPFDCNRHKDQLLDYFINTTINVLVCSWCREINRILSGKVSYEGDDEMKIAAQSYYNVHKNYKTNK